MKKKNKQTNESNLKWYKFILFFVNFLLNEYEKSDKIANLKKLLFATGNIWLV